MKFALIAMQKGPDINRGRCRQSRGDVSVEGGATRLREIDRAICPEEAIYHISSASQVCRFARRMREKDRHWHKGGNVTTQGGRQPATQRRSQFSQTFT